jgi:broad specificity phosphatase PhoE
VRHAEKSTEPPNDPHLSNEGKLRAEFLKAFLKDKKIKAIYSTERARTIETATPLSQSIHIPIQYYGNDTLENFVKKVLREGKNTLVVGHSNTSVAMINTLGLPHNITFIPEDDYDNMFIIKVKRGKAVKLSENTYGIASPPKK